jgi:hypothetical protein
MLVVSWSVAELAMPVIGVVISITLLLDVLNDRTAGQFRRRPSNGTQTGTFNGGRRPFHNIMFL